jgi:hypothetical protein
LSETSWSHIASNASYVAENLWDLSLELYKRNDPYSLTEGISFFPSLLRGLAPTRPFGRRSTKVGITIAEGVEFDTIAQGKPIVIVISVLL